MSKVPSFFNEVEDSTILRTLYDFSLVDSEGNDVPFDCLGNGMPMAKLKGTLVEPLPAAHREKMLTLLASAPILNAENSAVAPEIQTIAETPKAMNWDALEIGSLVDGYCTKTLQWYEGKVMDLAKIEGRSASYKVHFKGWNAKHDEWIDRDSPRMQPLGSMTKKVKNVDTTPRIYIPWYENTALYDKLEEIAGEIPHRKTMLLEIDTIDDWCMDYTYPNPSMWLIDSTADIWYRVCGPLVQGGGRALPSYAPTFDTFIERFAAAAHVAFCLIDFYPRNRKLSLNDVINEVTARTLGRIDQSVILQNAEFIYEQVSSLSHPDDWDKHLSFGKSPCLVKLKKRGEDQLRVGKRQSAPGTQSQRVFAEGIPKNLLDLSAGGVYDGIDHTTSKFGKYSVPGDPVGTERTSRGKAVLVNDEELITMQIILESGDVGDPVPFPVPSLDTSTNHNVFGSIDNSLIPNVLKVWSMLMNFKDFLKIPAIALEDFVDLLTGAADGIDYLWRDTSSVHPLWGEIHVSLLTPLVWDRNNADSLTNVRYQPPRGVAKALDSFYEKPAVSTPVINSVTLWQTLGCDVPPVVEADVATVLRAADCWVEAARLMLTEKVKSLYTAEYTDPVGELAVVIENLIASPYGHLFSHDPEKICMKSEEASEYSFSCPNDLSCILDDIKNGMFEWASYRSAQKPEQSDSSSVTESEELPEETMLEFYGIVLRVGDLVDAYSSTLKAWSTAKVVSIIPIGMLDGDDSGDGMGSLIQVGFEGWGASFDETYGSTGAFLAPAETLSNNIDVKYLHPDHIPYEKTYMLAKEHKDRARKHETKGEDFRSEDEIIARVRALFQEAINFCEENPENSELRVGIASLLEEFDEKCAMITRQPSPPVASNDFEAISIFLGEQDYYLMPTHQKIIFLEWLCNEMLSSSGAKKYLEEAIEKKSRYEKEMKQKSLSEGPVAAPRMSMGRASRGNKRPYEEGPDSADEDNDSGKAQNRRKSAKLKDSGSGKASDNHSGTTISDTDKMLLVHMRMEPIGTDRNGTVYWSFPCDENPYRLFCEVRQSGGKTEWRVLSTEQELQQLIGWLSEFGRNESALKALLMQRVESKESNGTNETSSSSETPSASSAAINSSDAAGLSGEALVDKREKAKRSFDHPRYYRYWLEKMCSGHFHLHEVSVNLTARGQMELGVKDLDGRIVVTAYKYNEQGRSCSKEGGVLLGDQLVCVNSNILRDINSLQIALRAATAEARAQRITPDTIQEQEPVRVRMLVLRHPRPQEFVVFKIAFSKDAELKSLPSATKEKKYFNVADIPVRTGEVPRGIPSILSGIVLQMLFCSRCPYATSATWDTKGLGQWAKNVSEAYHMLSADSDNIKMRSNLIFCLKMALLELEHTLAASSRALKDYWVQSRFRCRWRNACFRATSFAQLSASAVGLYRSVDWEMIERIAIAMEFPRWQTLVPKNCRVALPYPNDKVVYYADGEMSSRAMRRRKQLPEVPESIGISKYVGRGVYCSVRSSKFYSGGPINKTKGFGSGIPYAKLELIVLNLVDEATELPSVRICSDLSKKRTRLFNRLLNVLYGLPAAGPFIHPVNAVDAPDYREVVKTPMDLTEISRKVKEGLYETPDSFVSDIELIRSNCVLYCTERYPTLIPFAKIVYDTTVAIVEKLKGEFESVRPLLTESKGDDSMEDVLVSSSPVSSSENILGEQKEMSSVNPSNAVAVTAPLALTSTFASDVITVFIPLHKGLCEQEYIVDINRHSKACLQSKYCTEDRIMWKKIRDSRLLSSDSPEVDTLYGSVIGQCDVSPAAGVIPWKWLQVEWDLLEDQFCAVNPWEISAAAADDNN